jgi:hypothetical protein
MEYKYIKQTKENDTSSKHNKKPLDEYYIEKYNVLCFPTSIVKSKNMVKKRINIYTHKGKIKYHYNKTLFDNSEKYYKTIGKTFGAFSIAFLQVLVQKRGIFQIVNYLYQDVNNIEKQINKST